MIRIIFLLLGVGILIPWNAFVSAKPYFSARLCDETIGQDVVNFEQYFGLVWNVSSVLSLGLVIVGQMFSDWWKKRQVGTDGGRINLGRNSNNHNINNDRIDTATYVSNATGSIVDTTTTTTTTNSPSAFRAAAIRNLEQGGSDPHGDGTLSHHRNNNLHEAAASSTDHSFYLVMGPLFLYMVVFSIQAGMVLIPNMDPHRFLIVTLVGLAVCGMCGAIATAGIVSTAGLFPSHIGINPFFSGQALGGVVVSVANFAAATLEDPHEYWHEHCDNLTDTTVVAAAARMADASTTLARVEYVTYDINDFQSIRDLDLQGVEHITAEPTCSLYHTLDWAVFSFFAAGCIVLLLCLVGYQQIHKYRITQHRDDYVVVSDHPSDQDDTDLVVVGNNSDHVDVVHMEVSPRIGLELHNHIERRKHNDYHNNSTPTAAAFGVDASLDGQCLVSESGFTLPTTSTKKSFPASSPCPKPLVVCGCSDDNDHDEHNDENDIVTNNHRHTIATDEDYTDELDEGAVFSAIRGPVTCVFLVFTVTLCLFPSWVSELRSSHQCQSHFRLYNDLYVPWSFVLFNVGDLVGRLLSERVPVDQIRHLSKKLVVAAIGRAIYFPLFLMCLSTTTTASHGRNGDAFEATTTGGDSLLLTVPWWVIPSDVLSMTVQFTFAVTNGLLVSTAFMHSPHLVGPTTDLQERASEMMTFAVCFGLLSGSMLAFPYLEFATWVLK